MKVAKQFTFEAAHNIKGHSKCGTLHGHSYTLEVVCEGPVMSNGMVIDFADMKKIVNERVISKLDHQFINDVIGQDLATSEFMLDWIAVQLANTMPLHTLKLWETATSYAEMRVR